MPRIGRLYVEGGFYHLIGRGLERRSIFCDENDKLEFLSRFGFALCHHDMQCLAWAIMPNHYHLLVRVRTKSLSRMMQSLLGGYAGYFNRSHQRVGYVFQNRYKSILCDADQYLLELIRYIHLNPVRAGILTDVAKLNDYPWTGRAGMLGRHPFKWHDVEMALRYFSSNHRKAIISYTKFVTAGVQSNLQIDLEGGGLIRSLGGWDSLNHLKNEHISSIGDERILGEAHFVEKSLGQDSLSISRRTLLQQQGWTFDSLVRRVCGKCGVSENELESKARANNLSLAKTLICYWGNEELGLTCREIAARLAISQQAVSKWISNGRTYCGKQFLKMDEFVG